MSTKSLLAIVFDDMENNATKNGLSLYQKFAKCDKVIFTTQTVLGVQLCMLNEVDSETTRT